MQGGESVYIKLSLTSSERDYKMDSQSTNQLPELRNKIPETKTQINLEVFYILVNFNYNLLLNNLPD